VPILAAFAEGLDPQRAGGAFDRLTGLARKASGPAKQLVASAIRVVAVEAAAEAYRRGRIAATRRYLVAARSDAGGAGDARDAQLGGDELAYDLALLDVTEAVAGPKLDAVIAQLERLAPRLPEALVTLGLAYERSGQPRKALEAWRRARKAGLRFAPLAAWIDWKQRMYPP
jgi:hypothetical protein